MSKPLSPVASLIKGFRVQRRPPDGWEHTHLVDGSVESLWRTLDASELLALQVWTRDRGALTEAARTCARRVLHLVPAAHRSASEALAAAEPANDLAGGLAHLEGLALAHEEEQAARLIDEADEAGCHDEALVFQYGSASVYALRAVLGAARTKANPSAAPDAASNAARALADPERFEREFWGAVHPDGRRDPVREAEIRQAWESVLCEAGLALGDALREVLVCPRWGQLLATVAAPRA